jgi:hypothetical protein
VGIVGRRSAMSGFGHVVVHVVGDDEGDEDVRVEQRRH